MNIGIFTDTYDPQINGVVISIKTLKKQLELRGHNVYVFTTTDHCFKKDTSDVFRLPSMPLLFSPQHRFGALYSRKFSKIIKENKLDIIHNQTEFSLGFFAKSISKKLNIPVVHTYHTMWENYTHYLIKVKIDTITPKAIRMFSKTFCNKFDTVIAPSNKTKQALISYGVTKPIEVIPNGIDFSAFANSKYTSEDILNVKKQFNIPENYKVILFLGRVAFEKSIDVIIKQLPSLLTHMSNFKFIIVGDGPAKSSLETLTEDLGISNYVIFAGKQPWEKVGLFYHTADVFVNASTSETQGITFIEAMASGTTVVAKYDSYLDGVIIDNVNGKFFTQDDEFPTILFDILSNDEKRKQLSENAMLNANEFSAEKFGEKMERAYLETILNKKDSTVH
ncbi:MAG TPA: glycosyltransferase family 4 protein [Clostridiales bacterium]|nr:MAG: hypothetical protein A2Y22_01905 [Clostridiales bacterium GWD2_32_59]HAN09304.1 glycosyltransferase family 4 protein [Clostridiales bacterium]